MYGGLCFSKAVESAATNNTSKGLNVAEGVSKDWPYFPSRAITGHQEVGQIPSQSQQKKRHLNTQVEEHQPYGKRTEATRHQSGPGARETTARNTCSKGPNVQICHSTLMVRCELNGSIKS